MIWLQSDNVREGRMYSNTFEKRLPSFVYPHGQVNLERFESLEKVNKHSLKVIEDFSTNAASKLFEQEIREAVSTAQ